MHRLIVLLLGALIATLAVPLPLAAADPLPTPTTSAVAYRQDVGHSSSSSDPIGADLTRLWQRDLGGRVQHTLAVDGRVLVTVARSSQERMLLCLDARTGVDLWPALALGHGATATLAYGGGRVVVAADGHLDAVDVVTGDVVWSRYDLTYWAMAPVVRDGRVYVPTGAGGEGTGVAVLDLADGRTLSTHGDYVQTDAVALTSDLEVLFMRGYNLAALSRSTGVLRWEHPAEGGAGGAVPTIGAGAAWTQTPTGVEGVELTTGARRVALPNGMFAVAETVAVVSAQGTDPGNLGVQGAGPLSAHDPRTGRVLWSTRPSVRVAQRPLVTRDLVFALLADGRLEAFDRRTGARRGGIRLPAADDFSPLPPSLVVAQGLLHVASGRTLTALGSSATVWPSARRPVVPPRLVAPAPSTAPDTSTSTHYAGGATRSGVTTGSALRPPLAQRWTRSLTATTSPLLTTTHAYVVTRSGSPAHWYARRLRLSDGSTSWGPVDLGTERMDVALDGTTFVATGASGRVLGLNASTGSKRWELTVTAPDLEIKGAPAVQAGRLFSFAATTEGMFAFAVSTVDGTLLWSRNLHSLNVVEAPAVSGGVVSYAGGGSTAYGLSTADGSFVWRRNVNSSGDSGLAVVSGTRMYLSERVGGGLVLDNATGRPVGAHHGSSRPVVAGDVVYGVQAGRLVAESTSRRTRHWRFRGDGTIDHAPTYANGHLLVSAASGQLSMVNATTGALEWKHDTGRPRPVVQQGWKDLVDAPVVGGGGVLFALPGQLAFFRPV